MGIIASLLSKRDHPATMTERVLSLFAPGWDTHAGVDVSPERSLQVAAVYACVRVIAESVAVLPLVLYRRLPRGKARAQDHPLYPILHDAPNPQMTSVEFREALTGHLLLWGNAYAEIEYDRSGRVRALWPLRPDRMIIERGNDRSLRYIYSLPDGRHVALPSDRVMHLRGLGFDGIRGYSPIWLARQSLGLAMASEEFGARLFGNGTQPGIVLRHPGHLKPEAVDRLRRSVEARYRGLSNAHRVMILEEGMDIESVGLSPGDAQFIELRQFQLGEIARFFRVPPHKIGDLSRATFSNIEHQSLEFVTDTLLPWLRRWEQRISQSLLLPRERGQYFAEHLVDGLLRGDIEARYQAYNIGIQAGFLTRNEVREKENLNPIDGLDEPLQPLNMVTVGEAPTDGDAQEDGERGVAPPVERRAITDIATRRRTLAASQEPLLVDVAGRIVRREAADVGRAVERFLVRRSDVAGFLLWLEEFYREHASFAARNMLPPLTTLGRLVLADVARELGRDGLSSQEQELLAFIQEYVDTLGTRWAASSRNQLGAIVREASSDGNRDMVAELQERLVSWEETQPEKTGRREAYRATNAIARASYALAGVTTIRWASIGESCPYCRNLNGRVVSISGYFLEPGEFFPDGADVPLLIRRRMGHPPAHDGCDCVVLAGG